MESFRKPSENDGEQPRITPPTTENKGEGSQVVPRYGMLPELDPAHKTPRYPITLGEIVSEAVSTAGEGGEPPVEPPPTTFAEAGDYEGPFGVERFHHAPTPAPHEQRQAAAIVQAAIEQTTTAYAAYASPESPLLPDKPSQLELEYRVPGGEAAITITKGRQVPRIAVKFTTQEALPTIHEVEYYSDAAGMQRETIRRYAPSPILEELGISTGSFEDQRLVLTDMAAKGESFLGSPMGPELLGMQAVPPVQAVGPAESAYLRSLLQGALPAEVCLSDMTAAINDRYDVARADAAYYATQPEQQEWLRSTLADQQIEAVAASEGLERIVALHRTETGILPGITIGTVTTTQESDQGHAIIIRSGYRASIEEDTDNPYLIVQYANIQDAIAPYTDSGDIHPSCIEQTLTFEVVTNGAYATHRWQSGEGIYGDETPANSYVNNRTYDGPSSKTVPMTLQDVSALARFLFSPKV